MAFRQEICIKPDYCSNHFLPCLFLGCFNRLVFISLAQIFIISRVAMLLQFYNVSCQSLGIIIKTVPITKIAHYSASLVQSSLREEFLITELQVELGLEGKYQDL